MNPALVLLGCTLIAGCVAGFGFYLLVLKAARNYDLSDQQRTFRKTKR